MAKKDFGKIIGPVNPYLKPHEWAMVNILLENGYDIEFIPESRVKGDHSADIRIKGLGVYEMKSPKSDSSDMIHNTLRKAKRQSENIIIGLARTSRPEAKCIHEAEKWFTGHNSVKSIWIIGKTKKINKITSKKS